MELKFELSVEMVSRLRILQTLFGDKTLEETIQRCVDYYVSKIEVKECNEDD